MGMSSPIGRCSVAGKASGPHAGIGAVIIEILATAGRLMGPGELTAELGSRGHSVSFDNVRVRLLRMEKKGLLRREPGRTWLPVRGRWAAPSRSRHETGRPGTCSPRRPFSFGGVSTDSIHLECVLEVCCLVNRTVTIGRLDQVGLVVRGPDDAVVATRRRSRTDWWIVEGQRNFNVQVTLNQCARVAADCPLDERRRKRNELRRPEAAARQPGSRGTEPSSPCRCKNSCSSGCRWRQTGPACPARDAR